jgi:hypothetical protein
MLDHGGPLPGRFSQASMSRHRSSVRLIGLDWRPRTPAHQIEIWCAQLLGLPCSVNDAVNVLPCSTCTYLNGGPLLTCASFQDDASFRPPPGYGSSSRGPSPARRVLSLPSSQAGSRARSAGWLDSPARTTPHHFTSNAPARAAKTQVRMALTPQPTDNDEIPGFKSWQAHQHKRHAPSRRQPRSPKITHRTT